MNIIVGEKTILMDLFYKHIETDSSSHIVAYFVS